MTANNAKPAATSATPPAATPPAGTQPAVAKTVFRLHRVLWRRTVRTNPAVIWMAVLTILYGFIGSASMLMGAFFDIDQGSGNFHALTALTVLGAFVYLVAEVTMPAGEKQVTAVSLRSLPLRAHQLYRPLFFISLWTTRVLAAVVISATFTIGATVILALANPAVPAIVVAVALAVSAVMTVCTLVIFGDILGRGGSAVATMKKERLKLVGSVGVFVFLFAALSMQNVDWSKIPLSTVGEIGAWTPVAASTGWAVSLAQGSYVNAVTQLVIASATLAAGVWVWRRQIASQLTPTAAPAHAAAPTGGPTADTPAANTAPAHAASATPATAAPAAAAPATAPAAVTPAKSSHLLLPGLPKSSPMAIEFSRSMRYLTRDSRLAFSLVIIPIFLLVGYMQSRSGISGMGNIFLMMMAVMSPLIASNDYGYDGPGGWVKLVSPVVAHKLLLARHWAHLCIPTVLMLLACVAWGLLFRDQDYILVFVITAFGIFFSGAGFSLLLTVFNPYPVSPPGTSPWGDKSGYSAAALIASFVTFFIGWLPGVPGAAIMTWGISSDSSALFIFGAVLALAIPVAVYAVIVVVACRRVDGHSLEIYAKVRRWAG